MVTEVRRPRGRRDHGIGGFHALGAAFPLSPLRGRGAFARRSWSIDKRCAQEWWWEVDWVSLRLSPADRRCAPPPLRPPAARSVEPPLRGRFSSTGEGPVALRARWWWEVDSNHRRRKPADLQSALVGHLSIPPARKGTGNLPTGRRSSRLFLGFESAWVRSKVVAGFGAAKDQRPWRQDAAATFDSTRRSSLQLPSSALIPRNPRIPRYFSGADRGMRGMHRVEETAPDLDPESHQLVDRRCDRKWWQGSVPQKS